MTMDMTKSLTDEDAASIIATISDYTMVHETGVRFAMESAIAAIEAGIEGEIVECGVWRGGCSVAMLLAQRAVFGCVKRRVHLLDSFEGLPAVDDRDGPLAASWQAGADPKNFFDNCRAAKGDLIELLQRLAFADNEFAIWEGWFSDTLPPLARQLADSGIAMLRLDSDWYESTKFCLETLIPLTSEEATVVVDDYYAWDGCARAVHDFLSEQSLPYRIKSLPYNFGAYFIKKQHRTSFEEF